MARIVRTDKDRQQAERDANARHNEMERLARELRAAWRRQFVKNGR